VSLRSSRFGVQAALIGVAAIWGGTFVLVAEAVERYPLFGFLFWRFLVAVVAFAVLFPKAFRRIDGPNLRVGLLAGTFLTAGYIFQTWGLAGVGRTTPARAAFITGLYVIFTPMLQAVLMRIMPRRATVLGAVSALAGLWLLSGVGTGGEWVVGDTLVVIAAFAYAGHMIVLGSTSEHHDTAAMTFVQLAVVCVACGAISLAVERPAPPTDPFVIWAILLCGVLASAVAFAVQTWAQRRISPARTALILVTEPAFGGVFGWAVAGVAPPGEIAGAALMLGGMVLAEAVTLFAPGGEKVEYELAVEGMPAPIREGRSAGQGVDESDVPEAPGSSVDQA
jgi:drug/metabolite transporter (DMT)-like permease